MTSEKDYYEILGLAPFAEDVVIRSAYKALAQKYHPDKNRSNQDLAQKKMQEINEAYSVLSDPIKKKQYDESYSEGKSQFNDHEDNDLNEALRSRDKDWNVACGVYPDLKAIFNRLGAVSSKLSAAYKIVMLDTKNFSDRDSIAINLEKKFLESYFGSDPRIIQFAKALIREKKRDAAKALNEYVRVIGVENSQQVSAIINKVRMQFYLPETFGMGISKEEIGPDQTGSLGLVICVIAALIFAFAAFISILDSFRS